MCEKVERSKKKGARSKEKEARNGNMPSGFLLLASYFWLLTSGFLLLLTSGFWLLASYCIKITTPS
jgi:hypothetical protein